MKVCSKCGIEKDEGEFHKDKNKKDGLNVLCKLCKKKWVKNNKEKVREYNKKWAENNKESEKERSKRRREKNKEYYKEYHKEYYKKNKEFRAEYVKNNIKIINGKTYRINTVPEELKPVIESLIELRKKNKFIKELKNG